MTSTFNPDTFMNSETQEKGSTQSTPVPEGEYVAVIKSVAARETKNEKHLLDIQWAVDDPAATEATGIEFPQVRQSIWLDLTPDMGLDMSKGKNIGLNRLRDALGQNVAGKAWNPKHLDGQQAKVTVKHRIDGDNVYVDVKGVAKV